MKGTIAARAPRGLKMVVTFRGVCGLRAAYIEEGGNAQEGK